MDKGLSGDKDLKWIKTCTRSSPSDSCLPLQPHLITPSYPASLDPSLIPLIHSFEPMTFTEPEMFPLPFPVNYPLSVQDELLCLMPALLWSQCVRSYSRRDVHMSSLSSSRTAGTVAGFAHRMGSHSFKVFLLIGEMISSPHTSLLKSWCHCVVVGHFELEIKKQWVSIFAVTLIWPLNVTLGLWYFPLWACFLLYKVRV